MAAYTANQVSISNGDKAVVIESNESPENVSKGDFLYISGSDPKEINRTYVNDNQNHVIELVLNWDSGNKTNQPAIVIPTTVNFRATVDAIQNANLLINDNMQAMSDWQSNLGTVTFVGLDGVERTVPTLASFLATLGTAAKLDVTVGNNERNKNALIKYSDWGIGEIIGPTGEVDLDLVPQGHYLTDQFVFIGQPGYMAGGRKYAFTSERTAFFYQQLIQRDGDHEFAYRVASDKSQATEWVRVFTDKNSVNALDYGVGLDGATQTGITIQDLDSFDNSSGMFIVASGTSGTKPDGLVGNAVLTHKIFTPDRQSQVWHTCSGNGDMFIRELPTRAQGWTPWKKVYSSGNTNFNNIIGDVSGRQLGEVTIRNASTLSFYKDISGFTSRPTSVTVTGTYRIVTRNGTGVITGIPASSILMESFTSNTRLNLRISDIDTSILSAAVEYELAADENNTLIQINP